MEKQLLSIWNRLILIAAGMLVAFLSFGQTATQIELTGTTTNLEATYNVATVVDPNLVITSNGTINGFRVQISQSYTTGDVLSFTGTLPSGVSQAFNTTTGVLSFTGSATAQQWQTLLRTVRFTSTSSVCYPTARTITFTAGTVYYNPLTGHYYEYVTFSPAQNWATAKSSAAGRSYFGRIGYLATFSSSAENNFVWKIMSNDGWFGASDDFNQINLALGTTTYANQAAAENKWSWVTGPEAGTQFSTGSTAVTNQYANWNGGEPNNSGGEHYGQFYSGSQGRWNDLQSGHTLGGYLCEYGGMPNDNTELTPFVSRNVTVLGSSTGSITGGGVNVCSGTNSTTLTISNFTGTVVRWESSLDNFFTTGTNITNTNQSYTVTNITQTTYYRAMVNSTSPNTCTNVYTSSVPVYVSPTIPGNITAINNTICAGGDVELTLSGNQGNVNKWQMSTNSGTTWTDIANTTTFHNQTLATAGTYLFRAVVQTPGCGSPLNTANKSITVISGTPPEGGVVSTSNFCGGTNSGTLFLTGHTGTIDKWQQSVDGGIVWTDLASSSGVTSYGFSAVSADRMYRAKITNGGCGSAYSAVGGVVINTASVAGTVTGAQNICGGFPISAISLSGNNGTIQWQKSTNNSTFTNITGATNNPLTQSVFSPFTTNTYVRAVVTNGACAAANSNSVLVTVQTPDTLYQDIDGDGFGNPLVDTASCVAVSGYVNNDLDCDDSAIRYLDADGDGFGSTTYAGCYGVLTSNDCNDSNPSINVLGIEICNLLDDDCDGSIDEGVLITFYIDSDNDGYGNVAINAQGCTPPSGYVSNDDDCIDTNGNINPGESEICNGIDEDCDLEIDEGVLITYYGDADGDGYGVVGVTTEACTVPAGYSSNDNDCDDAAMGVNPGASESCNGIDDNCNTSIDEGVLNTYYQDLDGDSYGNASVSIQACTAPVGYVSNDLDFDDTTAGSYPGAPEVCNSIDDDGDGSIDEGVLTTYYLDADNDGFGDFNSTQLACSAPAGYITNITDCDDASSVVYPGASETCNLIDDDCDGTVDEGVQTTFYMDSDGDGFGDLTNTIAACTVPAGYVSNHADCNDASTSVYPGASEVCNLIDEDCDGSIDEGVQTTYYLDGDTDGYGDAANTTLACTLPTGYSANDNDCDDSNSNIAPNITESCNAIDDDCDGTADDGLTFVNYYVDADGDGYGAGAASNLCSNPGAGFVTNSTDCNDADATLNAIMPEVCNNFDDDCDGTADDGLTFVNYYVDADGDGYGAGAASNLCSNPGSGYVTNNTDCNDADATLNSITTEVCNDFDDDCDGTADDGLIFVNYYVDADGDGYGAGAASNLCTNPGAGYVTNSTDCNDEDALLNSISAETCNNFDDDCDGEVDEYVTITFYQDFDADGFGDLNVAVEACTAPTDFVLDNTDCDDAMVTYRDDDNDGYGSSEVVACGVDNNTDCNDADATLNSISTEVCNNFDDDCNGVVDNDLIFIDYYLDADGDSYGAGAASNLCSDPGAGYVTNNTDCNDADATLNSINTEVCNNFDDDCNGVVDNDLIFVDYFVDADGDGFGAGAASNLCSNPGAGFVTNNTDCNDADAALNSITTEVCNNFDDDCNGEVDNDLIFVDYFVDADGDGYGAGAASNLCPNPGAGYVTNNTDCNDADAALNSITTEVCNNFDDDCNGLVDNDLIFVDYFVDADGDGYGAGAASNLCSDPGLEYSIDNTDCNDTEGNIFPTATEVCNYIDDNCNDLTDEGVTTTYYEDLDADGYGNIDVTIDECGLISGYAENGLDCVDEDASVNPSVSEICNLIDDNCDGEADEFVTTTYFADNDGDGFGFADNTVQSCEQPQDFVSNADDCDDFVITYEDLDGDGYGNPTVVACGSLNADDCDDFASTIYPGASEVCENLVDENCDGSDETCIYLGCTDVLACNYNETANTDDGSCTYPAQSYLNCDGTCINDTDADGVCDEIEVAGCTDATACNYDSNATDENGSCTYPAQSYLNCDGTCISDTDADGVCNEIEVAGCTDATACNYDSNATDDNGSCTYPAQSYLNCNGTCINDTDADGVCNEIEVAGCTDATACNYNVNATDENGSCTYPAQSYLNCNGTCINDTDADGVCNEIEVAGCTDATACNYNVNATDENGSCTYPAQSYLNCNGTCINDTDADGVCNEIEVAGCTEATACNYDETATDDDGSCILPVAEICNTLDDDCDGEVDEFVTTTYYTDIDNDGFGDINNTIEACALPLGYVTDNTDCDDSNVTYLDFDGDGFGTTTQVACGVENNLDCNDGTALVQPNASEICNEVDDNCNGTIDEGVQNAYYADADGDGFGDVNALLMACTLPIGYVTNTADCDDTQLTYLDVDQDGYGVGNPISCGANNNLDCNDINSSMNPGVVEICNGIDDNCSQTIDEGLLTTYYIDVDNDGFGDPNNMVDACTQPQGFVMNNEDCNDAASWANPNGVEVCNGVDDNCDGTIDEGVLLTYYGDADGDGFGNINDSLWSCAQPDGYIDNTLDCDDSQPTVFEGATEVYDGLDNNCNGLTDEGFEFIPDAFSPNQDGDYDYFVIDRLLPQEHVAIKVFNRWGGLVYESSDYQNDWNGFSNVGGHSGEEMSVGTYYYEIELQFSKKTYSGYITLWR